MSGRDSNAGEHEIGAAPAALSAGLPFHWLQRLQHHLLMCLAAERPRWPNWLPVLMGIGIGLYFALPTEPAPWTGGAAIALSLGSLLALYVYHKRERQGLWLILLVSLAVAVGYGAAIFRTQQVAAPRLAGEMPPRGVAGDVLAVDIMGPKHYRVLMDHLEIAGLKTSETPRRARITVRLGGAVPEAGERIRLRAGLMPPAGPAQPGAYDFGQTAWFQQLGALGYAVSPPVVDRAVRPSWRQGLAHWRQSVSERLRAGAPGERGAVAAAIITGDRSGIPEPVAEAFRLSGIAHLLAISGLHLGLVTGIIFFALRGLLSLVPSLALNHPIKKWAAGAALIAALGYTVLAGSPIPTERAFLMTALVLMAVMLDRTALSMRLVAVAAGIILLIRPESLLSVSFQMSFSAVVALIAAYEAWRIHRAGRAGESALPRWALYLLGVGLTSLIAGFATGLYGAYHFNHFANYGLITNLIAVPVMGFWVMPWAVVTMLLMPFGLEHWGLLPMGWGIEAIIWAARTVAAWPGSVWLTPSFGIGSLALMTLGGLWLALWRLPWRYLGAVPLAAGLVIAVTTPRPDLLINDDGSLIALRTPGGELALNTRRGSRITRETWMERDGQEDADLWRDVRTPLARNTDWLTCDGWGCVYRRGDHRVALLSSREGIEDDCRRADMVIAPFPLPRDCRPPLGTIDRYDVWREGAQAVWLGASGAHVRTVVEVQGKRPWSRKPGQ